ncbi:MAG: hypothetical protein CMA12_08630 [Euryarchaeota archaeon]|nr:hypothetical protein [Euryarchaeota archaeon]|tara:strand:+ start:383 stop:1123 length:741 start_codon:yes stop_codon:yes gene_type:complete
MNIILDKKGSSQLLKFREILINEISNKYPKFDKDLSNLHKYIKYNEVNDLRINLFKKINKSNWEKKLHELLGPDLIKIIGPDISIQTKLNLSILMPNDKTSLLPMHSDSWSADTPFQINSWIPLTNAYETNSMFLLNKNKSLKILNKISKQIIDKDKIIKKIPINKNDFVNLDFGEILIFNPTLLHGNLINKTNHTRVSLNIRFKSLFAPEPKNNPDRRYGSYYKDFLISENSNFALRIIKDELLR